MKNTLRVLKINNELFGFKIINNCQIKIYLIYKHNMSFIQYHNCNRKYVIKYFKQKFNINLKHSRKSIYFTSLSAL